jgi:hypothetical protein
MEGGVVTLPTAPDRFAIDTDPLAGPIGQDRRRPGAVKGSIAGGGEMTP